MGEWVTSDFICSSYQQGEHPSFTIVDQNQKKSVTMEKEGLSLLLT